MDVNRGHRPSQGLSRADHVAEDYLKDPVVPKPTPTPLFHITAIDNLRSIASSNLLSKNRVAAQSIGFANIAFQTVQGHRSVKVVPIAPGGNLHD